MYVFISFNFQKREPTEMCSHEKEFMFAHMPWAHKQCASKTVAAQGEKFKLKEEYAIIKLNKYSRLRVNRTNRNSIVGMRARETMPKTRSLNSAFLIF